jgi:hypothetical protein
MENKIDTVHGVIDAGEIADIAQIETEPIAIQLLPHLFLFQLIAAEDSNLAAAFANKLLDHGPAERARPAGD